MIGGPAKILVRDPSPSVVGVSPITIRVRTPILIVYRYVRLPAVSVTFNVNPVSAGKIIVKVIDRYFLSPRLLKSRRTKSEQSQCNQKFFHKNQKSLRGIRLCALEIYSLCDSKAIQPA